MKKVLKIGNIIKIFCFIFVGLLILMVNYICLAAPIDGFIKEGNLEKVKELVEKDISLINTREESSEITPLHWAALYGHLQIVEYLIQQGAKINTVDYEKRTPLHYAVIHDHLEIVKFLIKKGAEINAVDGYRMTPLHHVAALNHLEILKYLIQQGAEINAVDSFDQTPLGEAVITCNFDVIKYLIQQGAEINIVDSYGKTLLDHAENRDCDKEIAEYLKLKGAKAKEK